MIDPENEGRLTMVAPSSALRFSHPDAHARAISGWHQAYEQLSSGIYDGELSVRSSGSIAVYRESASRTVHQMGRTPTDLWTFAFSADTQAEVLLSGLALPDRPLIVIPPDTVMNLLLPAGFAAMAVTVERAAFARYPCRVIGEPIGRVTRLDRVVHERLVDATERLLDAPERTGVGSDESDIMSCILEGLEHGNAYPVRELMGHRLFHRARIACLEMVRDDRRVRMNSLCTELGVSPRTLHNAFVGSVGLSPAVYLRAVRLNSVREELVRCTGAPRIADVAARWGFPHPSRFAGDYSKLFSEMPSTTLEARHRAGVRSSRR